MNKTLVVTTLVLSLGFASYASPETQTPEFPDYLISSTVEISVKENPTDEFKHSGTGWLYDNQSTVVTSKHVVDGWMKKVEIKKDEFVFQKTPYSEIRVTFNNGQKSIIAKLKENKNYDLAIMSFNDKDNKIIRTPFVLADNKEPIGSKVFGYGFPYDYNGLLLFGYVTGYHTETKNPGFLGEYVVTNAMFSPGNSGGPIINQSGKIIGMVDWIDRRSSALSFAMPVNVIKKAIDELK